MRIQTVLNTIVTKAKDFVWELKQAAFELSEPGYLEKTYGTPDRVPQNRAEGETLKAQKLNKV